jgi:4-hydroxyphenylpyruvate dioxygenase
MERMAGQDNPLGLNGFAFVEFTSPDPSAMKDLLCKFGFVATQRHPFRAVTCYRQGRIHLLLNEEPDGPVAEFRRIHGPSAHAMGFRVADPTQAFAAAVARGAKPVDVHDSALGPEVPAIEGIGGSRIYLVRDGEMFRNWPVFPGSDDDAVQAGVGLLELDHLTHNVRRGQMQNWSGFYRSVFGFEEQQYFDIKGQATGLFSQAMIAPDGAIRIPLNESQDDRSQIEEFLSAYGGEGIQHLAFTTDDIYATVEMLRARGIGLQDTVETYYELVDRRVPGHGEDLERLRRNRILIDGDAGHDGILLQIFSNNLFGPIFFEIIQRKGNKGFGNGNFQALFESIELDQIRRGVITTGA